MRPTKGRTVMVRLGADEHAPQVTREVMKDGRPHMEGHDNKEHPAIVTFVWPEGGETPALNLTVFVDSRGIECRREVEHVSKADPKHHAWDWPRLDQ